jgi:hypothetical protein
MAEEEKSEKQGIRAYVTDAVLIAIASGIVYLSTYFYEAGYCDFFGVPRYFINPNTTTILVSAGAIGVFSFSTLFLLGFAMPLYEKAKAAEKNKSPFSVLIFYILIWVVIGILLYRAYGFGINGAIAYLVLFCVNLVLLFGVHFLPVIGEGGVRERMIAATKSIDESPLDIWKYIADAYGKRAILLLLAPVVFFSISYVIGNGEASRQSVFLMALSNQDHVVLRVYGDLLIFEQVDRKEKMLTGKIVLKKMSETSQQELVLVDMGPLKGWSPKKTVKRANP